MGGSEPVSWLPSRANVTKVQLPDLYLRNLDKARSCVTWRRAAPRRRREVCPHPPQGEVNSFFDNSSQWLRALTRTRGSAGHPGAPPFDGRLRARKLPSPQLGLHSNSFGFKKMPRRNSHNLMILKNRGGEGYTSDPGTDRAHT